MTPRLGIAVAVAIAAVSSGAPGWTVWTVADQPPAASFGRSPVLPAPQSRASAPAAKPQAPPSTGSNLAPNAGAAGTSEAGNSSGPTTGRVAPGGSDNGGQLARRTVPGGTNHAPAQGAKPGSFSGPIQKD